MPPSSNSTKPLSTKKKSSRKGGSAAKISKNEIAVEVEKEEGEEEEDDDEDEPYSDQSSGISPYASSDEYEYSETDSKKSQSSKSSSVVTPKTSGIRTSYKIKNPEIKVVTNNLKTLPNLKILERRPLDEWWEEYLTSKNAGSVQPRNSYFPPQMEMQIGILMFDEDQTDMEHWKKWDDDRWIKQMRERLPLTTQSTDHIMDCNHIIDKLSLDLDFAKDNTEARYINELLKMEIEVVKIYISDQTKVDNLIDRLIRKIGKDAPYKGNEISRTDLHTYLKDKQHEKKLTSIPRYCGIVRQWLYGRREEYRTLTKRQFDSAPRLKHDESRKDTHSKPEKTGKVSKDRRTDRSQNRKKTSSSASTS